ncbi:hypothetical protein [Jeotgalibaca caeni]|uniref:hypothetical protein n=1 Tax=Jeotgalibaca caeni TaxID=3028623 RepID=UPI00237EDA9A|nr:hypothetical protein [Jeotgalibaca caeni]MDE1548209.1 hypothetical protein [Jeotgalibaca caeni]
MKKGKVILLIAFCALLLLAGIAFDWYTAEQGIQDLFYGTSVTSHIFYDSNFVGMFTAIAFIVIIILSYAGVGYFFSSEKKKIKILPILYVLAVFIYVFYIFVVGVTYIIEVLSGVLA